MNKRQIKGVVRLVDSHARWLVKGILVFLAYMKETSLSNKAQANQKIIAEFVVQAYAPRPAAPAPGLLMMKRREKCIDGPRYFLSAERVILDLGLLR